MIKLIRQGDRPPVGGVKDKDQAPELPAALLIASGFKRVRAAPGQTWDQGVPGIRE